MRNRTLYRIITGRLQLSRDGLLLYIHDPDSSLINDSYAIYDEVYENAIAADNYVESETVHILAKEGLWTPLDDRKVEEMKEQVRTLKIHAYENYYKKKELYNTKRAIKQLERDIQHKETKRSQLRRETCEGLAEEERRIWLILNSVYTDSGDKYSFEGEVSEDDIIAYALTNGITQDQIRDIAKNDPWRTMWMTSTKSGDLFNKPSTDLTEYQLALCQYSIMYDNVYQHMESPPDEVVMDDDCLDGWFIVQRKEQEKKRSEKNKKTLFSNPKIANSQEVFAMVNDPEDAKRVMDLNTDRSKQIINQRSQVINEKGRVKQGEFQDVKQQVQLEANKAYRDQMRGNKNGKR